MGTSNGVGRERKCEAVDRAAVGGDSLRKYYSQKQVPTPSSAECCSKEGCLYLLMTQTNLYSKLIVIMDFS